MRIYIFILALVPVLAVKSDDSVNNYIKAILENLKSQMKTGIPDIGMPILEPLSIPKIDEKIKDSVADVKIVVDKLKVIGLSKFETRRVNADLTNLRLDLSLFIPQVSARAIYELDGKIFSLIPLYGDGDAHLNVVDVVADGSAGLSITADGHLQMKTFKMNLKFSSVFANLENILGGGSLGQVVNGVVNMLGKRIFDHFQPDIMRELNKAVRGEINKALKEVKLSDIQGGLIPSRYRFSLYEAGNANEFLDQILINARPQIEKNLDPIKLPDAKESFHKKVLFVTVWGEAKVYDGWLAGLKTLHRTGNADLTNAGQSIVINAHLGLDNLKGHYRASAKFMNLGPTASASLTVSSVSVKVEVKQAFTPNAHPDLTYFKIERVGKISVNFSGLGPLNWIINLLSNLVGNIVKGEIVKAIESPVRNLIRDQLKNIKIPV